MYSTIVDDNNLVLHLYHLFNLLKLFFFLLRIVFTSFTYWSLAKIYIEINCIGTSLYCGIKMNTYIFFKVFLYNILSYS